MSDSYIPHFQTPTIELLRQIKRIAAALPETDDPKELLPHGDLFPELRGVAFELLHRVNVEHIRALPRPKAPEPTKTLTLADLGLT